MVFFLPRWFCRSRGPRSGYPIFYEGSTTMNMKLITPMIIALLVVVPTMATDFSGKTVALTDYKGRINIIVDTDNDGFADDIWQFLATAPIEFSISEPLALDNAKITYERANSGASRFTIESDKFDAVLSVKNGPINWVSFGGSSYQVDEGLEFVHRGSPDDKNYGLLIEAAMDAANYPSTWDSLHGTDTPHSDTHTMGRDEDRCEFYNDCDCTAGGYGSTSCHKTCIFLMECDVSCGRGQFSCCYCSWGMVPVCRCRSLAPTNAPTLVPDLGVGPAMK